jgi:hypothetical protein
MEEFHWVDIGGSRYTHDTDPNECPLCHHAIKPEQQAWSLTGSPKPDTQAVLEIVYRCPRYECGHLFIGQFRLPGEAGRVSRLSHHDQFVLFNVRPSAPPCPNFPAAVLEISPDFVVIYTQAAAAQAFGLAQVAGVGYRKALEFLVKDYCILLNSSDDDAIKKKSLGACITDHVDDANIKECAKRATWIGNDETHYVRKWGDKDIEDLKTLIQLTVGWINNSVLTKQYLGDMNP